MTASRTDTATKTGPRFYLTILLTKALSVETAQRLADGGAVVPSLHKNRISADILKELEQYVYIPIAEGEKASDTAKWTAKIMPRSNFEMIGPTRAADVDNLIANCYKMTESSLADRSLYRVTSGRLKGFYVRIVQAYESELDVSPIFGPNVDEIYRIAKGALTQLTDDVIKSQRTSGRSVRSINQKENPHAFVIDGHNMLYRSAFGNYKLFHSQNRHFIGAAVGFYHTTYRLCRAFPEYEMHFVFDPDLTVRKAMQMPGADAHVQSEDATTVVARREKMPEYKLNRDKLKPKFYEELSGNLRWILHFLGAIGFPVYSHPDHEGDNIIGTVVEGLRRRDPRTKIMIYSTDTDMKQLVDQNTAVYHPKTRSFDFNDYDTLEKVLVEFPVGHQSKINWARGVLGDETDAISSYFKWMKTTTGTGEIMYKADICKAARESDSLETFRRTLADRSPNMATFINTVFLDNLDLLTIKTDIKGLEPKLHQEANEPKLRKLLADIGLYKELEQFSERVIPALLTLT